MIPREILEQALADYEKAVEEIQGMGEWEAAGYLEENQMQFGLCHYLEARFDVDRDYSGDAFGDDYLGGWRVCSSGRNTIPTLTARLQLRINKLKELLNDNPLPLPK